jgi:hypothetical protein
MPALLDIGLIPGRADGDATKDRVCDRKLLENFSCFYRPAASRPAYIPRMQRIFFAIIIALYFSPGLFAQDMQAGFPTTPLAYLNLKTGPTRRNCDSQGGDEERNCSDLQQCPSCS